MKIYGKNGIVEIVPYLRTDPNLDVKMITIPDNINPNILLSIGFTPYDGMKRWIKLGSNPGTNPKGDPDIEFGISSCPGKTDSIFFTTDKEAAEAIWEWLEAQGVYEELEGEISDQT
ncbi:MAG: hypothetical protein KKC55_15590 [Gammaproteobacteria bacterium]|nr:hypothetical protein [Gammaproteobacteria bacterium]